MFRAALIVALVVLHYSGMSLSNQLLPICTRETSRPLVSKTKLKGIVCPMIKDEVGFLSEWVAFYEIQGFSHIIFYDNNSTTSLSEIDPWIKTGFVSIERSWWQSEMKTGVTQLDQYLLMQTLSAVHCKKQAVARGIQIHVSVDVDEYIIPSDPHITVMDELTKWFTMTKRGFALLDRFQFAPTPHTLEPVNLLTIEAYQKRISEANKMNPNTDMCECMCMSVCMYLYECVYVCTCVNIYV